MELSLVIPLMNRGDRRDPLHPVSYKQPMKMGILCKS